jgi:hypothetical protein
VQARERREKDPTEKKTKEKVQALDTKHRTKHRAKTLQHRPSTLDTDPKPEANALNPKTYHGP